MRQVMINKNYNYKHNGSNGGCFWCSFINSPSTKLK